MVLSTSAYEIFLPEVVPFPLMLHKNIERIWRYFNNFVDELKGYQSWSNAWRNWRIWPSIVCVGVCVCCVLCVCGMGLCVYVCVYVWYVCVAVCGEWTSDLWSFLLGSCTHIRSKEYNLEHTCPARTRPFTIFCNIIDDKRGPGHRSGKTA